MEAPLFTIVIPTHNRSSLLRRAIHSVINQNYNKWECIIIDDGSEDDTKSIVNEFEDSRIKYIYQEHHERSVARNLGISKSLGKYICFLDDDDQLLENHLVVLKNEIINGEYPIAVLRTNMIIQKEGIQQRAKIAPLSIKDPIKYFLENMAGIHTLCFHNSILEAFQFDPKWRHFQDTHLLIRVLSKFPMISIPEFTVVYNIHKESWSQKLFLSDDVEDRLQNNLGAINDLFSSPALEENIDLNLRSKIIAKKYLDYASGCINVKKTKEGRKYLIQAFKHYPLVILNFYFYKVLLQFFKN